MIHLRRSAKSCAKKQRSAGWRWRLAAASGLLLLAAGSTPAQQVNPDMYSGLSWRSIGPFRGGRVTAVAGIPGRPAVYYMGTPGGGVWKTTDGGRVWKPIFDDVHVASIGALALAPSNPDIVYVGTGEQTDGDGVFKSTDAGATWTNVGLRDTKVITSVLVNPRNPDIVLVGVLGQFAGAGPARGVFRTADSGKTWNKVLYVDEKTGVVDMCMDPGDHRVIYAALWRPNLNFGPPVPRKKDEKPDAAIYKSTDGGATWKQLDGKGLPDGNRGRIGVTVAPGDHGRRVFAIMDQGLFRSDDAGATWRQITKDPRVLGNFYFSRIFVDPKNADMVYVVQTSLYRSTDGGQTFVSYKGAPGGDDYHVMWIDPEDTQRMILGVDQGATVSLDGGKTWSSWFNQPTGQLYHVITDNQFPYHAYAEQQDSGTVAVPNRSDYGEITYRDWFSVGGFEFGYIAPDPLHPNITYAGGWYSTIIRFDRNTGQISFVFLPGEKYHASGTVPIQFSPLDPHTLYLGAQFVLKTTDGGMNWQPISPDLTTLPPPPASEKKAEPNETQNQRRQRGAISTLAASPVSADVIWAGTTNGLIHVTRDAGATWQNVSPPETAGKGFIESLEASPHDAGTAYAVIGGGAGFFFGSVPRHILRTHDFGQTWQKIAQGLPDPLLAHVVREDPVRKGLLFAGLESGVYVSFDDGDHWQSLQLNLPTATVNDLTVHGDDLVVATFGRGLWILDDLTPLRQAGDQVAGSSVFLFRPEHAMRVHWDNDQETPLPPEVPAGKNPPDGAILDYYLKTVPAGDITLEIKDEQGSLVRKFSSAAPAPDALPGNAPDYWFAPAAVLPKKAGMNRFVWDLLYPNPLTLPYSYYGNKLDYIEYTLVDHAIEGATPRYQPVGPAVVPGRYEVTLTVDGKAYRQSLVVEMDPRVPVTQDDLEQQLALSRKVSGWMDASYNAYNEVTALRAAVADRQKALAGNSQIKDANDALAALDKQVAVFEDGDEKGPGFGPMNRDLSRTLAMLGEGDMRPAQTMLAAAREQCPPLRKALAQWHKLAADGVTNANKLLEPTKLAPLPAPAGAAAELSCGESSAP
jgi:photosystem II stability/assembly factor-like uncharacterized protein